MKLVIWSDSHFHQHQEDLRPDRWKKMLRVMNIVHEVALREKADMIVHLGDFFESKRTVRSDVLALAQSLFAEMSEVHNSEIPQMLISGNHDSFRGYCKLDIFNHVPNVVVWYQTMPILNYKNSKGWHNEDVKLLIAPYGITDPPCDVDYDILLCHADICKGEMAKGIVTNTSTLPTSLLEKTGRRKICFNGHYHIPQVIRQKGHVPVVCVGAPYHLNWNDANGGPRGIIVADFTKEKCTYKRVWLTQFPQFFRKRTKDTRPNDFVQEEIQDVSDVATTVHESHEIVGGNDMSTAIEQYTLDVYRGERTDEVVSTLGKELYRGEA